MECREVREYLPAYADQAGGPRAAAVDDHLAGCSSCRAELEQYRELGHELVAASARIIEPPAWLLGTLTETVVEKAHRREAIRQRTEQFTDPKIVAGGAILVAGLAGAMLMRGWRRKRRSRIQEALAGA